MNRRRDVTSSVFSLTHRNIKAEIRYSSSSGFFTSSQMIWHFIHQLYSFTFPSLSFGIFGTFRLQMLHFLYFLLLWQRFLRFIVLSSLLFNVLLSLGTWCLLCLSFPFIFFQPLLFPFSVIILPPPHNPLLSSSFQATHYSFLATLEVLGKLMFSAFAGVLVDWFGFQVAFLFFLTLSAGTALHVWTATFTGALREHQLKEQPKWHTGLKVLI